MTESLSARSRATILGLQKDLIAAVKGKDFPAALMLANRLLELEPGNELVRQIKPVVEEKIELDELQSVSGDEEEEGEEGEESSGEEGDSEDEEEEEESDDEEEDEDEDAEEGKPAVDTNMWKV